MSRWIKGAAVVTGLVTFLSAAPPLAALPFLPEIPMLGGFLASFRNRGPSDRRNFANIRFRRDPGIVLGADLDLTCDSGDAAAVQISIPGQELPTVSLPCEYWKATRRGFKYRDRFASAGGVRSVRYENGRLDIKMKGVNLVLFTSPAPAIEIRFDVADSSFCGRFETFRRNLPRKVLARGPSVLCDSPAPIEPTATPPFTETPAATPTPTATQVPTDTPLPTSTPVPPTATSTSTPVAGSGCGNGIVETDEQCDDGNVDDGDCCAADCTFDVLGSPCAGDGNSCTSDRCDGDGMCRHAPATGSCDDDDICTTGDSCSAGVCAGTAVAPWINEISYDSYTLVDFTQQWDREEFVEIAAPAGSDLSGYRLLGIEGGGFVCSTGTSARGDAYADWTLPSGSVVGDDTGTGIGFLVVCFSQTSGEHEDAGECDVVLSAPVPWTQRSALRNGELANLTDNCPDGVLLLDPSGGFVDAVSYEGNVPDKGDYGDLFSGAPDIGIDPGKAISPRQSLERVDGGLSASATSTAWQRTASDGDTPGAANSSQALTCMAAQSECGNAIIEFGEDCESDSQCGSGWHCVGCWCEPAEGSVYTRTRYPIVLAHGLLGFDSILGIADYWFGISPALQAGGAQVFVTSVSQLNSAEVRGEQLIAQIEFIAAITGKAKVNLIGHSQGAIDIRYVASVRPDLVASVSSVAGPHGGADIADVLEAGLVDGAFVQDIVAHFANALGDLIGLLSGGDSPNDAVAALAQLTERGMARFNANFPAALPDEPCGEGAAMVNGIRYYSWSGNGTITTGLDPLDKVFHLTSSLFAEQNDGLVGRCSSHLGQVIRDDYFHNHLDEVNQVLGIVPLLEAHPTSIFRAHANRLKNAGL